MNANSNIERDMATVRNLIDQVINSGNIELCGRYLAADRIDHQDYGMPEGAADGHEGFRRVLGGFTEAFPDLRLTIQFMVGDGEKLVAYIETTGTHMRTFMGAPATGKRFKVNGTDIFEFNEAGLISHHWGTFDLLGLMLQLGMIPPHTVA
jgi:steroid delta-isomerase-like uncharacterized protein